MPPSWVHSERQGAEVSGRFLPFGEALQKKAGHVIICPITAMVTRESVAVMSRTVTFLIGNGFDLNLGLKTRYADFYPHYVSDPEFSSTDREINAFKANFYPNPDRDVLWSAPLYELSDFHPHQTLSSPFLP